LFALPCSNAVAKSTVSLHALRREVMTANGWALRDLYRTLEIPGTNRLRDAQVALDSAVRAAYGMNENEDTRAFLLKLNLDLARKQSAGEPITPAGLPPSAPNSPDLVSADCITAPGTR
jgi:hypothetical protein